MTEGRGKKGGDKSFEKEAKRLDSIRRRKKIVPVLIVIVVVLAFSLSPAGSAPRKMVERGVDAVKSIFSKTEKEPDAQYW